MEYDIKAHLGQQIENFLNAFANADVQAMERTKQNIVDIFSKSDNELVISSITDWDKKRQDEVQKVWTKASGALKTIAETKKNEQLFIDVDEIKNDVVGALNELEGDYWSSIRGLFLKSVKE